MTADGFDDDRTDVWLVEASRRLDEPTGEVARLISSIAGGLPHIRRPGRELDTDDERIRINERVLKQLLATRVRSGSGRLVVHVALHGDDATLVGVTVGLIARYHDDLQAGADRIRDITREVVTDGLGRRIGTDAPIDIRWQDVYTRAWLD